MTKATHIARELWQKEKKENKYGLKGGNPNRINFKNKIDEKVKKQNCSQSIGKN